MKLSFLNAAPHASVLPTPAGTLHYFGEASVAWTQVATELAGGKFPPRLRGNFAFVWEGKETIAAVDHVCTYPLFYSSTQIAGIFYELLRATPGATRNAKVDFQMEFLGGQSIGKETTYKEISRLLPGHYLKDGRQFAYVDLFDYPGDQPLDENKLSALCESEVQRLAARENALLLSGGTDSTTLAGIIKKLGLTHQFTFIHAHSHTQALTETHLVEAIAGQMQIEVKYRQIPFSGDVIPSQSGRQFSFWVENPFSGKRLAITEEGLGHARIFTGELGDQLFGGPKNGALLNYALQSKLSAEEVAAIWVNLSASYGKNCGVRPSGRILHTLQEEPGAREAYNELVGDIAALFSRMSSRDFLNRIMLLNYIVKGPYRTWAYSQDELDWVHPFASWDLFDYAFQLSSNEKVSGASKSILWKTWRPFISELPWSVPKHGFGIPSLSKLRISPGNLEHR